MIARTRYFIVTSLLVVTVGLGTGLVAHYAGFQMSTFSRRVGPEELQYVPRDAAVVAYADVHNVMTSELRQKMHQAVPVPEDGQREFESETGINIETDIDHVVGCFETARADSGMPGSGMVLARGRFNAVKIESLMCHHGAHVEQYQGKRLIVADATGSAGSGCPDSPGSAGSNDNNDRSPVPDSSASHAGGAAHRGHPGPANFAVAFIEPGLVAVGNTGLVRTAIDLPHGQNVTTNNDLMNLVRSLDQGNAWAIGRFDVLRSQAKIPEHLASQLPSITWFTISGHVNGGIRGVIRAETRDDEAANNLRDVLRGFMALAKMQTVENPNLQTMVQSLQLGGTGKTVSLSFDVPAQVFDTLGKLGNPGMKPRGH